MGGTAARVSIQYFQIPCANDTNSRITKNVFGTRNTCCVILKIKNQIIKQFNFFNIADTWTCTGSCKGLLYVTLTAKTIDMHDMLNKRCNARRNDGASRYSATVLRCGNCRRNICRRQQFYDCNDWDIAKAFCKYELA